ncbi:immunoglobulin superfamily member 1-like isoform X2 [Gopherus evgoodei]|uniref:immunoglobulin superfamily member 1-like isoform X2 n=1 Tax=Gopherus evgoodei TaxID=1825980 RepID=UPI0011CF6252|nr:immunoglobulin superfamily member 1-like isoform X2 [Gopherus evgoodei]
MVSALTILFLSCWQALWSEVSGNGIQIKELDAGARDEFTIPSARRGDGGFYSCRSHSSSELPMDPCDYVRIVVAELSYPKPSISLSPHGEVVLGGTVIIRCECRCQNVTVLMYKLGNPDVRRWAETAGGVAEFTIDNVSWRDTGSYSCQYGTESDPPVWSHPSDPVELMVAGGPDPTQPGTAPAPTCPVSVRPDYTQGNIVRLALASGVLLALALIVAELPQDGDGADASSSPDPSTLQPARRV